MEHRPPGSGAPAHHTVVPSGSSYLAVLATNHPPAGSVKLVPAEQDTGSRLGNQKIWFNPLHYYRSLRILLGTVTVPKSIERIACSAHLVQRGRRGSKPPEPLFILDRASQDIVEVAQVKVRGLFRAIERAVADVSGETPAGAPEWWLAVELARRGYVRRGKMVDTAGEALVEQVSQRANLALAGNLVVWEEYTGRCVDTLVQLLTADKRNPLLGELPVRVVLEQLDISNRNLATHIIQSLAGRYGLDVTTNEMGVQAVLSGELAPPPLVEVDGQAVAAILAAVAESKVARRRDLLKLAPSQPHVQAWMFAAGKLIQGPDGFIFTDSQLLGWLAALDQAGIEPGKAGVRDIKDHLGLPRRNAEALRAWLVETSG